MAEEREPKRVRQACQNCRRKKTRCSGEKPVCAFCSRLNQDCCYDQGPLLQGFGAASSSGPMKDLTLSTRVALLESKLSLLDNSSLENLHAALNFGSSQGVMSPEGNGVHNRRQSLEQHGQITGDFQPPAPWRKFAVLPPLPVVRSVVESYFKHCHNQPYCYFSPPYFYQQLEEGRLPSYLLMAVMASAGRFSTDLYFDGQQQLATETYSRIAWTEIFEKSFSDDDALNITVVQAANILAVVDFTNGRHKLAWVKIGLAVRFAQILGLPNELPQDLTADQQCERLSTFWSVYLLDRLVSCSYTRPPTIADNDCAVMLPSDLTEFAPESDPGTPTLAHLSDNMDTSTTKNLNHFAHTIFMASTLGRVNRYSLQQHRTKDIHPPWDFRSGYVEIYYQLLNFETFSDATTISFTEAIDQWYTNDGVVDQAAAGHFVFSLILYHVNQCLLHHPFLLHHKLGIGRSRVPPSFLKDTLRRAREHAQHLTIALRNTQKKGLSYTSLYAYAAMVGGTIHCLFSFHPDPQICEASTQLLKFSIEFLETGRSFWSHYPRIVTALRQFQPDPLLTRELVSNNLIMTPPLTCLSDQSFSGLWDLLDYGWLSDSAREVSPISTASNNWPSENGQSPSTLRQREAPLDSIGNFSPNHAGNGTAGDSPLDLLPGDRNELDSWTGIDVGDEMTMISFDMGQDHPWSNLVS